jgi:hypothetical protein
MKVPRSNHCNKKVQFDADAIGVFLVHFVIEADRMNVRTVLFRKQHVQT